MQIPVLEKEFVFKLVQLIQENLEMSSQEKIFVLMYVQLTLLETKLDSGCVNQIVRLHILHKTTLKGFVF